MQLVQLVLFANDVSRMRDSSSALVETLPVQRGEGLAIVPFGPVHIRIPTWYNPAPPELRPA